MRRVGFIRVVSFLVLVAASGAPHTASAGGGPSPQFTCGDVVAPPTVSSNDALATLQSAVDLRTCEPCACDSDGSTTITASDALLILKTAVGQPTTLACPFCCSECACTPQTLTLTLDDVAPCEGCIPRVPPSNFTVDYITIDFAVDLNTSYEARAVGECVWEAVVPNAVAQKTFFGDPTCSGGGNPQGPGQVTLRIERTAGTWEVYFGQYAQSLIWGDVIRSSVESDSCEEPGKAVSQNETCALAESGNADDYDIHATGGTATVMIADLEPVCVEGALPTP